MVQRKLIQLVTRRVWVRSLASFSGLRIQHCHELWCRQKTQLRFCVPAAVMQTSSCSSDSTPNLGTSICHGCSPKKNRARERMCVGVYMYQWVTLLHSRNGHDTVNQLYSNFLN